jgi:hypothetical protein
MVRECLVLVVCNGSNAVLGEDKVTVTNNNLDLADLCKELVKEDAPFPELRGLAASKLVFTMT